MKFHSRAILRVLFLFAVITCSGITMYSDYQASPYSLDIYAADNSIENRFSSEVNTSEDDQIHYYSDLISTTYVISQIPITQDYSLILKVSCSVWQPPKIS
jgi:hypothetical protein